MADCLLCGSALTVLLDFGSLPLANRLRTEAQLEEPEASYPLRFAQCSVCKHFQLADRVPPEELFTDYTYASGVSEGWRTHCADFARGLGAGGNALDIGGNDGTMAKALRSRGWHARVVDPTSDDEWAIKDYWTSTLAASLDPQDLILAQNVLAHVPDPVDFLTGIALALKPDGVCYIEVPYAPAMFASGEYPQMYHEHMSYWTIVALEEAARVAKLALYTVSIIPVHGTSIRCELRHGTGIASHKPRDARMFRPMVLESFRYKVEAHRDLWGETFRGYSDLGLEVWGYGASAKAMTLLNLIPDLADCLDGIMDDSPRKQGLYAPGKPVAIMAPRSLKDADVVLNLAWNWKDEIEGKIRSLGYAGPIITPEFA